MNQLNLKSLEPRIVTLAEIKLVAKVSVTSFSQNKTQQLWQCFRPMIKGVSNKTDNDTYSVRVYPDADFFKSFDPDRVFQECAGVRVNDYKDLPEGLEELIIPTGKYAIFDYIGRPSEAPETFRYILSQWLPGSQYTLDDRPHCALMGEKYKGEHPDSEEELLIPII